MRASNETSEALPSQIMQLPVLNARRGFCAVGRLRQFTSYERCGDQVDTHPVTVCNSWVTSVSPCRVLCLYVTNHCAATMFIMLMHLCTCTFTITKCCYYRRVISKSDLAYSWRLLAFRLRQALQPNLLMRNKDLLMLSDVNENPKGRERTIAHYSHLTNIDTTVF